MQLTCNSAFEGGNWLLVRFKSLSSSSLRWHRANDGLRGTDVYGYPGQAEYSVHFSDLMTPDSELLFAIGEWWCVMHGAWCVFGVEMHVILVLYVHFCALFDDLLPCIVSGTGSSFKHWLIIKWDQIDNSGIAYTARDSTALKSSSSKTACGSHVFYFLSPGATYRLHIRYHQSLECQCERRLHPRSRCITVSLVDNDSKCAYPTRCHTRSLLIFADHRN